MTHSARPLLALLALCFTLTFGAAPLFADVILPEKCDGKAVGDSCSDPNGSGKCEMQSGMLVCVIPVAATNTSVTNTTGGSTSATNATNTTGTSTSASTLTTAKKGDDDDGCSQVAAPGAMAPLASFILGFLALGISRRRRR